MATESTAVEIEDETVEDTDDGGAIVRLENEQENAQAGEHFANLVETIPQIELDALVSDLVDKISRDKQAREKRDQLYEEGLRRTGLADDAPGGATFSGASKVVHPMLVKACVDFSARVMKEIFPPGGPVKTKIFGKQDQDKREKAERKAEFMNWQSTQQMRGFRGEIEQLTTQLPLGGAQYLKMTWDKYRRCPQPEFVPIDDVYLPFAATNFYTAERKTHVQYITAQQYAERVKAGMYIDVDLAPPQEPEQSAASRANDKIEGRQPTGYNEDGLRTIYEVQTSFDVGEGVSPYIITIDKSTQKALGLYRNWTPDDELREALDWFVEFPFVPWRGAYPIGLTHMIGSLAGSATGALRALLDSAHINNFPAALKLKSGGSGQNVQLQATGVTEIDAPAGTSDIRSVIMGLPFNPPSPVLFQLLGFLADSADSVVQTTFEKLSDQNPNAPVGTTLALIEQGMVVFSSIHSRLHSAMARVFSIIHRLNATYLTEDDIHSLGSGIEIRPEDFDGPLDVVPVSDPAIFSETQRFAQIQALQQRAQAVPQLYDARKVEEMFVRTLKLDPKDVMAEAPGLDDMDPVSENVAACMGRPLYVLPGQDHEAHLMVHLQFVQSQMFGADLFARSYLGAMIQHIRDHLLNYYMAESRLAIHKAMTNGLEFSEAQEEAKLIGSVQKAVELRVGAIMQIVDQMIMRLQKFQPQQQPQDPAMQAAQLGAQVQREGIQARQQVDQQKLKQDAQKEQGRLQEAERKRQADMQRVLVEQQAETQRNQADNQTAIQLEQMSDHSRLTNGHGINP